MITIFISISFKIFILYSSYFILILHFFHSLRHYNRLLQCSQFVVHLLQLVFVIAFGYDAAACLEPQYPVAADECTDGDGLIQTAVQTDEPSSLMSCMARTFGAPLNVPAGKVSMNALIGSASLFSVPLTRLTR